MTQVAGGDKVERKLRKKAGQWRDVEEQREKMCVASRGACGSPSGMLAKLKSGIGSDTAAAAEGEELRRR
ncbi:hypothetical protein HPP92_015850 [Vanilla planifolia]|uniref:Uncharacterized protein n=1 Tax=Vanilla planifolia TaxID=51239 RepID=A0A835QF25_VANPL|nr:hypothetical protein HPP92_015850 [Vanilla planifolia]